MWLSQSPTSVNVEKYQNYHSQTTFLHVSCFLSSLTEDDKHTEVTLPSSFHSFSAFTGPVRISFEQPHAVSGHLVLMVLESRVEGVFCLVDHIQRAEHQGLLLQGHRSI